MIGETGVVIKTISGRGKVFVHGEYWQARSQQQLNEGTEIEVVRMLNGLELEVRKKNSDLTTTAGMEE